MSFWLLAVFFVSLVAVSFSTFFNQNKIMDSKLSCNGSHGSGVSGSQWYLSCVVNTKSLYCNCNCNRCSWYMSALHMQQKGCDPLLHLFKPLQLFWKSFFSWCILGFIKYGLAALAPPALYRTSWTPQGASALRGSSSKSEGRSFLRRHVHCATFDSWWQSKDLAEPQYQGGFLSRVRSVRRRVYDACRCRRTVDRQALFAQRLCQVLCNVKYWTCNLYLVKAFVQGYSSAVPDQWSSCLWRYYWLSSACPVHS